MNEPKLTPKQRHAAFREDLVALLEKHQASLSILMGDCSDTHGIYDEGIGFQILLPLEEGKNFRTWTEDERLGDGFYVCASDIRRR